MKTGPCIHVATAAAALLVFLASTPDVRADQSVLSFADFPADAEQARNNPSSLHYNPNPVPSADFLEPGETGPELAVPTPLPAAGPVERPDAVPPLARPVSAADRRTAALARRDAAFSAYTRLVTTGGEGDVEAALAEYKAAVAELERLEAKPTRQRRRRGR